MATLEIDEKTYQYWSLRAKASGQTVEEWLKAATGVKERVDELTVEERLKRFDDLLEFAKKQNVNSGGTLDDSRDSIYGDRGL